MVTKRQEKEGEIVTIQAIETRYAGCRFRSRLEARWAVFFDALGIEWQYESQGYHLGSAGYYLPDFYLPEQWIGSTKLEGGEHPETWIEIKANEPTTGEMTKLYGLSAVHPNHFVYCFWGDIPRQRPLSTRRDSHRSAVHIRSGDFGNGTRNRPDYGYAWAQCSACGHSEITPDTDEWLSCSFADCPGNADFWSPDLARAYMAASSARFEFGESGHPSVTASKRTEEEIWQARVAGWARKRYGEYWEDEDWAVVEEQFVRWLEDRGEL